MTTRTVGSAASTSTTTLVAGLSVGPAAALSVADVLRQLGSSPDGLSDAIAAARLAQIGPNAVRSHQVRAWAVLGRQLRSALLVLLLVTATVSFFLGDRTDAIIIGLILAASVGLGFVNEYRAERAAQALHTQLRHTVTVVRDSAPTSVDVLDLVPGDVVRLQLGASRAGRHPAARKQRARMRRRRADR